MEEVLEFVKNYWQLILSALLALIGLIATFVNQLKKGATFSEILLGLITEELPTWINAAEGSGTGEQKKVKVLNRALSFASKKMGRQLTEQECNMIVTYTTEQIEKILETPQKKAEESGGNKNVGYRQ